MIFDTILHMLAIVLVLIGALNWGFTAGDYNLVEKLANITHKNVATVIYILVALSALYLMFNRNTYLPFLGKTAFPCGLLKEGTPDKATHQVEVSTGIPNSAVVYWAAEPSESADRYYTVAYGEYENSGVTRTDAAGVAKLSVRKPTGYNVPSKSLEAHIHYRTCLKNGLLGEVKTVFV